MGVHAIGIGKQAGEAWHGIGRYEDAPLILFDGRGVERIVFFHAMGARAFGSPVPRGFSLSVLVALDGSVGTPAHSSEIQAEGQDRNGTRGKTDTH